jgi:protein-S-isoprenylcysteine O-methyltransferase Ste14
VTPENAFRFVGLALVIISFAISAFYRRRAAQTKEKVSSKEEASLILYLRSFFGLAFWLSMLAYFINPAWMAWAQLPLSDGLRWCGALLMVICVPLFYWLFSSLDRNITHTVATRQEHTLVVHGPYRWVRHPLYTVGFLFFVGLSLLTANWFIFVTMLITFMILLARTPIEEEKLIERFGDQYRQYMQKTGRFIPKIIS